jgi:hypothetical protein
MRKDRGIPADQFQVPPGKIGITVDVPPASPTSLLFDIDKATAVMGSAIDLSGADYYAFVRGAAQRFVELREAGDDSQYTELGLLLLWTVFHHPTQDELNRGSISSEIRRHNRCHVSWFFDRSKGLAIAVGQRFFDLDEDTIKDASEQTVIAVIANRDEEPLH